MLLVEDSRVLSTMIKQGVEQLLGVDVTHCSSLAQLKTETAKGPFHVAVLDLNLPDAPNGQALDHVIALGIPAIVFTGTFNDQTRTDILARDVVDCIIKNETDPISKVVSLVDRVLTNSTTTVLVASGHEDRRADLVAFLRRQQFVVREAGSGTLALSLLTDTTIDLVVSDYTLPDMTASALVAEISEEYGDQAQPVVAVARENERSEAMRFLQNGGADVVAAPFDVMELGSRIHHAAALHNRTQALHRLAARDYLTDLFNRRYFFQSGPRRVEKCLSRGGRTSIAILDIDHFKRLNDTYGHEVGDLVLKAVARTLRQHVVEPHLLARLGGEEFGILFHDLDVAAGTAFCEVLRESFANTKLIFDDDEISLTVSIGIAPVELRETFVNYLNAADQFLYMAKHAGRNRVFSDLNMLKSMAS